MSEADKLRRQFATMTEAQKRECAVRFAGLMLDAAERECSTALDLLEAVDTAERERHAALVAAIEALPPGARGIMRAVLETLPALPVERVRACLYDAKRGARWE